MTVLPQHLERRPLQTLDQLLVMVAVQNVLSYMFWFWCVGGSVTMYVRACGQRASPTDTEARVWTYLELDQAQGPVVRRLGCGGLAAGTTTWSAHPAGVVV